MASATALTALSKIPFENRAHRESTSAGQNGADERPAGCKSGKAVRDASGNRLSGVVMKQLIQRLFHEESGQDLIEYALVAAVIALGAIAAMGTLSNAIGNTFNGVGNSLNSAV